MGPLMINMAFMPLYMWEMWDVTPVTHERTHGRTVESSAVFSLSWIRNSKRVLIFCLVMSLWFTGLFSFLCHRAKNRVTFKHLSNRQCVGNQSGKYDKKSIRIHSVASREAQNISLFEWEMSKGILFLQNNARFATQKSSPSLVSNIT